MSREMKHSGIEWIGEIPKEWKTQKFKTITKSMKSGGTPTSSNAAFYNENGTPWVAIGDMRHCGEIFETQKHLTEEGLKDKSLEIYPCGTLLYSIYASVGKVSVLKIPAAINQAILALSLNEKAINGYGKYLLVSMEDYVFSLANGNTQFNLNGGIVANLNIPLPPLSEQQKIANYLDKVCAEVDEMIALQEQMIEELKAYKQSVITEAVTKGLNPDVPMRDSGIDWIGEVPEGWEVKPLKWIIRKPLQYGANESGLSFNESLPRYVRITDILNNDLREDLQKQSLTEKQAEGYILEDNDILFARSGGTVGKAFIYKSKYGRCAFAGYLIRAQIDDNNNSDYIYYFTQSSAYEEWKRQIFIQATIQNIGADRYSLLEIPMPPLKEQQSIASYLDTKCAEIDALIAIKQAKIDELKDYKKSVIYEYVTGKKEVV